jgi:hypothetical protein
MRSLRFLLALTAFFTLNGCHSAFIAATISNRTAARLSLLEVDYPSASFGRQALAPGEDFHYRFKVLGSGPIAVLWTDAGNHQQKSSGPSLREGDEGNLTITFTPHASPTWKLQLVNRAVGN